MEGIEFRGAAGVVEHAVHPRQSAAVRRRPAATTAARAAAPDDPDVWSVSISDSVSVPYVASDAADDVAVRVPVADVPE